MGVGEGLEDRSNTGTQQEEVCIEDSGKTEAQVFRFMYCAVQ